MSGSAPIAIFAYRRADLLGRCIESLKLNPQAATSPLFIFCDGAKSEADADDVGRVRDLAQGVTGFAAVRPILREQNLGLAKSIITGVAEVLDEHDRLIVVEDDLILSRHFLAYMNEGLARYAGHDRVASIHGYSYPVAEPLPETFFVRGTDCLGWGTWRRAWRHFEPDGQLLLRRLREEKLTRRFDLDGAYPYTRMLANQVAGKNSSWAVRWHASCFLHDMLTLFPGRSLVLHAGTDELATHSQDTAWLDGALSNDPVILGDVAVEESVEARQAIIRFMRANAPSFRARLAGYVRRKLKKWRG